MAQNLLARANAFATSKGTPNPDSDSDSASAQDEDPFAQYAQLRDKLMEHATTLANNLMLGDGFVNQRVHALTRLLDRVLALDEILPDYQPEKTIRHEYFYDGIDHDKPPWQGYDLDTKEGFMRYTENFLKGQIRTWKQLQLQQQGIYDATYGDDDYDAYLEEIRDRLDYSV